MGPIEFLVERVIAALTVRIVGRCAVRISAFTQQRIERLRISEKWMKRWFWMKYPWNAERRVLALFPWGWDNLE